MTRSLLPVEKAQSVLDLAGCGQCLGSRLQRVGFLERRQRDCVALTNIQEVTNVALGGGGRSATAASLASDTAGVFFVTLLNPASQNPASSSPFILLCLICYYIHCIPYMPMRAQLKEAGEAPTNGPSIHVGFNSRCTQTWAHFHVL
jgi:hypothetical protein